jgi:hypothetical protein
MALASVATHVTMAPVTTLTGLYRGWCASPVPAAQVVNVTVEAQNPQDAPNSYFNIPVFQGFATQTGPNTPNGALIFGSFTDTVLGSEPYGVVVWYNE